MRKRFSFLIAPSFACWSAGIARPRQGWHEFAATSSAPFGDAHRLV